MCLYLTKRGSKYYFRRAIPEELRPAFDGATEFTFSLWTKDKEEAKRKRSLEALRTDGLLDQARARLGLATTPTTAPPSAPSLTEFEIEQADMAAQDEAERQARWDAREPLRQRLLAAFGRSTLEITPREAAMRDLLRDVQFELTVAQERSMMRRVERAEVRRGIAVPSDTAIPPQMPPQPAPGTPIEPSDAASAVMLDGKIVDLWAAERQVQPQGVSMYKAAARWLYERTGRKPVDGITKQDIVSFKAKLVEEGCSPPNIKNKLSRLRTLLQWAADNGYAATNVADGVTIRDTTAAKNKRRSFDLASLNALFGSPLYVKEQLPADRRSGGKAAYWLPLLALFTGARREELGQLRPDDVVRLPYPDADGVEQTAWFLKLIEEDDDDGEDAAGTKLKNAESERYVPVHPELERLGFIDFANAMRAEGKPRIFHQLKANKYGKLTDKFGQWFTDYRRSVGVTDKRLVFHSFRHTFTDYARHANIAEGVQRQLVGHSGEDVHDDYGSGYSLHRLVEGMKLYKVPGLKLPGLPESATKAQPVE